MDKLTVKSGTGELTLRKSQQLVGLKKNKTRSLEEPEFVHEEILKNLGGFNIVTLKPEEGKTVDEKLDEVRQADSVEVGTHVYFAEGSNRPLVPTGFIYITFQEGVSEKEQQVPLEEFHLELVKRSSPSRILVKVTSQSPNPIKVANALQQISLISTAEPDLDTPMDSYAFVTPPDNLIPNEWHLQNNGMVVDANYPLKRGADAKVIDAWRRLGNAGSSNITIAVIDNGFDLSHPDLKDKVIKPFDFWSQSQEVSQGDIRYTHGTPCASVALAASNGQGIVGSAPNAQFMPLNGTSFSNVTTEQMLDYCIKNGADIITCSWGTTDSTFSLGSVKEAAIARAAREGRNGKGCVILFAVGNDDLDYVNFYAAHPDVIGIGASTSKDEYASYSNRGRQVSVCAPSNGDWPIIAARASWDKGMTEYSGNQKFWYDGRSRGDLYKHFGGTSSSTPLVAGICALILSANPDLTAKEVKQILQQTADKIGSPAEYGSNGQSLKYGYGRVNADKAVAEALRRREASTVTPAPPVEVASNVSTGKGLFRFSVQRQPAQGWGVQVGVYYEYGNVLIQTEKLQNQFGQPVIIDISELSGKTAYKVIVGIFADAGGAQALQQKMLVAGVRGFPRNLGA